MLSFSTEFPVPETVIADDVCEAVREWISGSPHTRFNAAHLTGLGSGEVWDAAEGLEFIESIREDAADACTVAIIYRRDEEDFEWITTIVFAAQTVSKWISVRVECEPRHPRAKVPAARKPILIRTLLRKLGGGVDGEFKMAVAPIVLASSEVELAARCINGDVSSYLPIVYVSSQFNGHYAVNPNNLAALLFGMAHVVVEPNRAFSIELMKAVDGINVYGGTIALYWPEGGGRRSFFKRENISAGELERAIFEEVRRSLVNRRPLLRCTLAAVKEQKSRRHINALKDAGSKAVDEYVSAFEEENRAKDAALAAAEAEIVRLKGELRHIDAQSDPSGGLQLDLGGERDFYEGEIREIVREALNAQMSMVAPDGRRQHILYSIVLANAVPTERERLRDQIKMLLRDYQSMDGRTKRELEQLGFSISESGKHYKLVFQGDPRYTFTLSKTGSDFRGGRNAASDLCRLLF
ncbi:hypothetical protein NX773_01730 [Massilia solisilvae]|uniref:DUF3987 domain-containing protein n=1 Tax=Massilia solisilvae TaxID=1811225 RepID=A0ABT2BED7_9BURK|nr:hypothetical protein [Massilia solisilvae]MCS0606884.1 hypothetical protein [Massilia solisilvae]